MPPKPPSDDESTSPTPGRTSRARKSTTGKTGGGTRKSAPHKSAPAKKGSEQPPTVGVIRSDPLHLGEDAYTFRDGDQQRVTKSVYIPRGTVERARAAVAFCKAFTYNHPELEDQLPTSLAALFHNAINQIVDQIEDQFNDGQPLRRVYKLQVGPSRSGAARGAAARAAAREDSTEEGSD
ncbi:hypothetical protein [Actinomadura opuntiae]|uniref:hypothetical protein n=1 Tax=Actinomadura sp. OS1-43 TaxID=604315 RepID=UPI00255A8913|nr:hypothetical protein [Actinomadura sp. OS1-43]MDL4819307.1 hypothetical protein [Actinomadura sp. OS1-43]